MKQDYYKAKASLSQNEQMNMTFEFQTWIHEQIIEAQKRLSEKNNFTFMDDSNIDHEAGHVANMTNQLRKVLSDVRIDAAKYHKNVDTNFRKCPYCPAVWQKIEGCDGETSCGNRPSSVADFWSGDMSTFRFNWNESAEQLVVQRAGAKSRPTSAASRSGYGAGCGRAITWSSMAPVKVDISFDINPSSTNDLKALPLPARKNWNESYQRSLNSLKKLKVNKAKK